MLTFLLCFVLISIPYSTIAQPRFHNGPLRFDKVIESIREFYQHYPDNVNDLINSPLTKVRPDTLLNKKIFSQNQTTTCERDLEIIANASSERQIWALKILDAWGKPLPSGILKGNMYWLGDYDECVDPLYQINNKSFVQQPITTQYCSLRLNPNAFQIGSSISVILGLCVPASCTRPSIVSLLEEVFNMPNITTDDLDCSNERNNEDNGVSTGVIAISVVLSFLALVVLTGTIIDIVIQMYIKSSEIDKSEYRFNDPSKSLISETMESITTRMPFIALLAEFSAIRTLKNIFKISHKQNENSFTCLNGIRVLSLFWVILGHTFLYGMYSISNVIDFISATRSFAFQLVIGGLFSVDTFFLLSGFLTAVLFVREVRKEKLSIRLMVLYYVHRYLRLTPTFILVMFVSIYLTPYFGRGPLYPVEDGFESEGCRNGGWWTSFLYIGNLFHTENTCLDVTWYLFNDMQFHWIAPLALIPFAMGRKGIGYIVTVLFVLVSIGSILGLLVYYPSMSARTFAFSPNSAGPSFFEKIYMTPWCRIAPYAFGLLTGFIISNTGRNYPLNKTVRIIGNILAVAIGLTCIFSTYGDYVLVPGISRAGLIAYQTLSRTAWSISVSWLIFVCSINQGGVINQILSFSIWTPLARLNYAAYLIHIMVIFVTMYNQIVPLYYQGMTFVNIFVSHLFFSYLAAIVVVIFFEAPFFVIEKKILKR